MATILNTGQSSYRADLEAVFDTLQDQRTAMLDEVRSVQLAARVLMLAESRRLAATAAADDPRPAKFTAAGAVIAQRISALDIEAQISVLRVAPEPRVESASGETS